MAKISASEFIHRVPDGHDNPDSIKAYLKLLTIMEGVEYDTESDRWNIVRVMPEPIEKVFANYVPINEG